MKKYSFFIFLNFILFSCSDSFEKKIESLPDCQSHYIKNMNVKVSFYNNIGNHQFNFSLTPIDKKEYYFYLMYKDITHFLYYPKPEENKYSDKVNLYVFNSNYILFEGSKKVKNSTYDKTKKTTLEYHYEMTDKQIKKEVLNIIDSAKIISQDKYGHIIKTYCNLPIFSNTQK